MPYVDMAERLVAVRTPTEIAISPDGAAIAFALHSTVADIGSHQPSDLYLLRGDGPAIELTSGSSGDAAPAWSPDGRRLAFVSDRLVPGHAQPYTMLVDGGSPTPAAILGGSAEAVSWSADGSRLLVLAADPGLYGLDFSARAVMWASATDDPIVERHASARRRLFLIDLHSGAVEEVGPPDRCIWEFDWDGDATVVALVSDEASGSGWYRSRVVQLDLMARTDRTLYRPTWQLEGLALSPDRAHAAIVEGYSSDPGLVSGSIKVIDLATSETQDPWPGLESVGLASWCADDSLVYARTDGTGTAMGRAWLDGRRDEVWRGDAFIGGNVVKPQVVATDDATTILTTHEAHGLPPEIARFDPGTAGWRRLTGCNDALLDEPVVWPDARVLRWTATDGLEIEGWLMTPHGATGPLPLIVAVHGGPSWCWNAYFSDSEPNGVVLADAGFAVLLANPRGSAGRGHAFCQAVIGDPGGGDFNDLLAGIDACVAAGVADPERVGIAGLSYGGYMAGWAVGQTDRFRAAVAMSVVADFRSFHLTTEISAWDEGVLDGRWYDPEGGAYAQRSPVTHAHHGTTPTLVTAGALDRCTPADQGRQLWTAIAATGTETELVTYPREGHINVERAHALDQIRRTTAWFERFLRPGA